MSSVPGRKDGDGATPPGSSNEDPARGPTLPMKRPPLPPTAQPNGAIAPTPTVVVSRTVEVGPTPSRPPSVVPPPPRPPSQFPRGQGGARPKAPGMMDGSTSETESLWDSVEALLDDVDAGFDAVLGGEGPRTMRDPNAGTPQAPAPTMPTKKSDSGGMSSARDLFLQLAATHVRHVRDFMIDVKAGAATAEWLGLCVPSVDGVKRMAAQLELTEISTALDAYLEALKSAAADSGFSVDGAARERLLATYAPLIAAMPQAFGLDAVKSRREGIIVQALLLQIEGVRKVTIDKLYAAGLSTLDALYLAKPEEIAVTTGVDPTIANRISERFRSYRKQIQSSVPDEGRSAEHAKIEELTKTLAEQHAGFERAERDDDGPKKRELRKAREATFLEIKVLMARLGEVELVSKIEKLPFGLKAAELTKYTSDAKNR